jgi:RNA polymerase sigma-70 factor (ECF subfamily)
LGLSDAELVRLTRSGERDAYSELVARYQGHVYGLAYSLVDNWTEAQDIAQEAFIRAYVNLDQLRDPDRFAAWLRRVTFSVAMNWMKAHRPGLFDRFRGRVDLDTLEIPDFRPGPPEVVEKRELARAVLRAVASLPPKYRLPLTMFHLDGLSYQKVADFLDIPLGTAKSLVHRARKKLSDALAAYAVEEVSPVVQEVFNEHRLPEEFASKVLDRVPALSWEKDRECTFAGALEAALAVTEHPYQYSDIMGFTGLAFRVRWFCGNEGARWCPSSSVGEMDEEIIAAEKATGWPLRVDFMRPDDEATVKRLTAEIMKSVNAGRPVLAYEPGLNMDVVYGYEQGGRMLLLRDRAADEDTLRLPPSKLGFMLIFPGDHKEPMSERAAAIEGIKMAVCHWRRDRFAAGPGEYWYGKAALSHWSDDLGQAAQFSEDERTQLRFVSWWNFVGMRDARRSAVTFLEDRAVLLDDEQREPLARAAEAYRQEADILDAALDDGHTFSRSVDGWTPQVQRREQAILSQACELEEEAVGQVERALQQIGED